MDSEYTVGALCDLIASKGQIKKTKNIRKMKNENVKSHLHSETSHSPKNLNSKKFKKIKSTKNANELPVTMKEKVSENSLNTQNEQISKIKNQNIANQLKSKTINLPENLNSEKIKKRKSKKNANELSVIKKKKVNENTLNTQLEVQTSDVAYTNGDKSKIAINPDTFAVVGKTKKPKKIKGGTVLEVNSTTDNLEKTVKKKKTKKPKDNKTKPNDKIKTIENKNSLSKLRDIKSSSEYIEKESRTVFVGNVPVGVKMSAVKSLFNTFGEIETTRLRSVAVKTLQVPKRVSIMKGDFHSQRDTANVYVRFKTVEQAQSALALNATQFEGHTIRVDMALNSGHKQNKKKGIFIGNLPYSIQEDEIWDFFKDCGVISAVRIVRDNATGVSKGFGYVDFETKESVELAIQLQGKICKNRVIRIKRIETKPNSTKVFNKKSIPFKRTIPINRNSQNFQGETMKPKMQKKKPKPTKTDLMRKKMAKQLNH